MGGEKVCGGLGMGKTVGSPPRGRGKAVFKVASIQTVGITPAWAGKSQKFKIKETMKGDHPRVGGEKTLTRCAR